MKKAKIMKRRLMIKAFYHSGTFNKMLLEGTLVGVLILL